MKKKSIFLGLPLALFALTACEDEPEEFLIWDFTCYSMEMEVSDEAGNDLLDPANADNILGDSIRVLYNGEIYSLDTASIGLRSESLPQKTISRTNRLPSTGATVQRMKSVSTAISPGKTKTQPSTRSCS